ncbi:insulinase family protein [Streptomyces sp. me109]|uniref:insulinase family protein n=1 Tax=Streptomyces sp. me109 TaxID=1827853 RepID=UPI0011CDCFEB|nr:insulinase family protein [Streptomyces sp. me109]TXS66362.1 insulinase family protein [Streptomyces sp. me109]
MSQALHHTEVDGIPTLFAYATGPMRAGLVFRVGVADETLARSGITHLVEHLALHRQGLADHHFNGATKGAFTHFHAEGAEHEIVAYLEGVCASLTDLPMERLETEKEILRTEEARREPGQLPLWRYGAQGYGLVSYPEWGVRDLRPDDLRHWAGTWFTRDNAVLWIAGEHLPAGLSLKLPAGRRHAMPAVTSALPTTPAYFSDGKGGVLLDSVVADSTAARLYAGVLERELSRALRQEGGYSYTAATDYTSRRDGFAVVTAFADALPAKQDAVLGGFVDVLAALRAGRIAQGDLDAVRARADASLTAHDAAVRRLPGAAEDLLAHRPPRGFDELRSELWAVTPGHLYGVALEAAGTALLQAPAGHDADWAGYTAAPTGSSYAVTGTTFASRHKGGPSLIVGSEGVSVTTGDRTATVLHRACAAVLNWPDGGRRFIGLDGLSVEVEPGLYGVDAHTMATVDAAVHPSAVVRLPPRQRQPRPGTDGGEGTGAQARGKAPVRRTGGQTAVLVVFGLLAGLWSLPALAYTVFGFSDPETSLGEWAAVTVFLWGIGALLAWPAVRVLRNTRRG